MSETSENSIRLHEDREYFRESVFHTARIRGLAPPLVEKDYYCSVLLAFLFTAEDMPLVFRGGTCLSKVYTDFFRLSEDCDFVVPITAESSRSTRRRVIQPVKDRLSRIEHELPCFSIAEDFKGHNESTQYIGKLSYTSIAGPSPETVKIEVGLREPLLQDPVNVEARTALVDPFTERLCLQPFSLRAMTQDETFAEKIRAALTRREPAVRDFFDLDYAYRTGRLEVQKNDFLELVQKKLSVPGNASVDMSEEKKKAIERQRETRLKPVVSDTQLRLFDLPTIFAKLKELAESLESRQ